MMKRISLFLCTLFLSIPGGLGFSQEEPARYPAVEQGPRMLPLEARPTVDQIKKSISKGTRYFIEKQNPKGTWGSARKTKSLNIYAPGSTFDAYLAGTTGLGLISLLEVEAAIRNDQIELDAEELQIDPEQLKTTIDKAESWVLENLSELRRSSQDAIYNVWGHAYGTQALVRMLDRYPEDQPRCERIRAAIEKQIELIEKFECLDGGWCYYDFDHMTRKNAGSPNSFVSAAMLLALWEVQQRGIEVPRKIIDRALESNRRQRYPDFSYAYGEYLKMAPMYEINRPPGSLARSQACNLVARHWGDKDITIPVLENWLHRMFARNGWLDMGRKRPIPHESWAAVAGYFYYYGVYYSAFCIEELPEKSRGPFKEQLAALLIERQGTDGSWFDYPLYDYGHAYGTGYGLISILKTLP